MDSYLFEVEQMFFPYQHDLCYDVKLCVIINSEKVSFYISFLSSREQQANPSILGTVSTFLKFWTTILKKIRNKEPYKPDIEMTANNKIYKKEQDQIKNLIKIGQNILNHQQNCYSDWKKFSEQTRMAQMYIHTLIPAT